nr:immunoglobulin light chain junction region [Macaca mulatta]MOV64478.1 immunoglobulin light chain junction region [Macaca mulatta]MOV64996.1 immunoglobulin light chain junction region [Macaca mulatta]MOV65044.1 immunoglobulin light chain junction region [Macaca mulatta]MOV65045.1 immunoglobulin light chain junction region [Macaca mulatta]
YVQGTHWPPYSF